MNRKFARIEVADNWADEMDIEYVTYMPMSDWKKLEAKIAKCSAYTVVGIGTNEDVEYEDGNDYLEHCSVTEVGEEGETHGHSSLDPEEVYECLKASQEYEKKKGIQSAKEDAFVGRLYREIIDDYDKNKKEKYILHMHCVNAPYGMSSMFSSFFDSHNVFELKCDVVKINYLERNGKVFTLFNRARDIGSNGDYKSNIRKFIDDWKMSNYGKSVFDWNLNDNPFLAQVDMIERLGNLNPLAFHRKNISNPGKDIDFFISHARELIEDFDYYGMFDTREEAEDTVKLIEGNKQRILDAGYSQCVAKFDEFVKQKQKQFKALYGQR